MIEYGKLYTDGKIRIRIDGYNVDSCKTRNRVPDKFGWMINIPFCDDPNGNRIDLIRIDP
jgi:hypothetical protein